MDNPLQSLTHPELLAMLGASPSLPQDALDQFDQVFAGFADQYTGGLSTDFREWLWGSTAAFNHDYESQWFKYGQNLAILHRLAMAMAGAAGEGNDPNPARPSGLGDLTQEEVDSIQATVDQAGRPLNVVGSAARGARGPGSDIDYLVPPGSLPHYQGLEGQLPGIDPQHGIVPGVHNPHMGPAIRFEPNTPPHVIPEAQS
jgi:hypothetical protein